MNRILVSKGHTQDGAPLYIYSHEDPDSWQDGLIIGSVIAGQVQIGQPQPDNWFFIDHEHATVFMKSKCREIVGRPDVDFIYRDMESKVMPVNRMPKPLVKM